MEGGQQQAHHQQIPRQITVQQPIVLNTHWKSSKHYLLRGAKLSNGWSVNGGCIAILLTIGGLCLLIGLPMVARLLFPGVVVTLIGGAIIGPALYCWHLSKEQFEALPRDHPDRLKYGTGDPMPVTTASYPAGLHPTNAVPPPAQATGYLVGQPGFQPMMPPGQGVGYPVGPTGMHSTPPPAYSAGDPALYPVSGEGGYQTSGQAFGHVIDESPPPYSEVASENKHT